MDLIQLLIQLVSGALDAYGTGTVAKDYSWARSGIPPACANR